MAYGGERPDLEALRELEEVLRRLTEELAKWRRRALTAERRIGELGGAGESRTAPARRESGTGAGAGATRAPAAESRRAPADPRLDLARSKIAELVGRLKFLEQQAEAEGADQ